MAILTRSGGGFMTLHRRPAPFRYGLAFLGAAACVYLLTSGLAHWGLLAYWAVGVIFVAIVTTVGPLPAVAAIAVSITATLLMPLLAPIATPAWRAGPV